MSQKLLTVSLSPHVKSSTSVHKLMYGVVIAMLPMLVVSMAMFGLGALKVMLVAVAACIAFEYLIQKYILKTTVSVSDGSALVTGMLLAFNLPAHLPFWMVIIGALVAIGLAKLSFGGLGNNPFNPALVARVFLLASFPVEMTTWPMPGEDLLSLTDANTGATVLSILKEGLSSGKPVGEILSATKGFNGIMAGFMGNIPGSLGEVSTFAILLGLGFMLWRKIITWHIPISVIVSSFLFAGIFWLINDAAYANPLLHLTTGGLMIGAVFMATDYVTSPMVPKGMIIYGVSIGIITMLIRLFGSYPEGVSFAILVMNGFTPLINKYVKPKRFGEVKNGK